MLSTLILIMGVTPLAASLLGEQIVAHGSWRAIFWVLVAFALSALVSLCSLPETLASAKRSTARCRAYFQAT